MPLRSASHSLFFPAFRPHLGSLHALAALPLWEAAGLVRSVGLRSDRRARSCYLFSCYSRRALESDGDAPGNCRNLATKIHFPPRRSQRGGFRLGADSARLYLPVQPRFSGDIGAAGVFGWHGFALRKEDSVEQGRSHATRTLASIRSTFCGQLRGRNRRTLSLWRHAAQCVPGALCDRRCSHRTRYHTRPTLGKIPRDHNRTGALQLLSRSRAAYKGSKSFRGTDEKRGGLSSTVCAPGIRATHRLSEWASAWLLRLQPRCRPSVPTAAALRENRLQPLHGDYSRYSGMEVQRGRFAGPAGECCRNLWPRSGNQSLAVRCRMDY